jgi:hypothetical protein
MRPLKLDEFYFTTADKKIVENCRFIVPNFINDYFISITARRFVLPLQFNTGPSNFCDFPEIVSRLPSVGGVRIQDCALRSSHTFSLGIFLEVGSIKTQHCTDYNTDHVALKQNSLIDHIQGVCREMKSGFSGQSDFFSR